MKQPTLTDKIFNIIILAGKPVTAADIRRALPDNVEKDEVSSRLAKLVRQRFVFASETNRRANTGPKVIKCYSASPGPAVVDNRYQQQNMFQLLPQTQ